MRIRITCDAPAEVPARALTEFLYDLNMIYERLVILTEGKVDESWYSSNFYRRGRRLDDPAKELKVIRITRESPLLIDFDVDSLFAASLFLTVLVGIIKILREAQFIEAKTRRVEAETELVQTTKRQFEAITKAITELIFAEVNELKKGSGSISEKTLCKPMKKDVKKLLDNPTIGIRNVEQITSEDKPKHKEGDEN
jgi:hypothetical protein